LNLLGNAFDSVHEHSATVNGQYSPTVTVTTRQGDGRVKIRVSDNGPGIPAAIRDRIFEPFFTTKPTGTGTGLGLSLSYDIVTQGHGGTLTVKSEEGHGATFIVTLPANQTGAASSRPWAHRSSLLAGLVPLYSFERKCRPRRLSFFVRPLIS